MNLNGKKNNLLFPWTLNFLSSSMGPRPLEPADAKYFTIAYYNVRRIVFSSIPFYSMW
jgi:hypothetical protein